MPVIEVKHPLVRDCLTRLRDARTGPVEFRRYLRRIARSLAYEALRDMPVKKVRIKTPLSMADGGILAAESVVVVPILRAGMGMLDGLLDLLPGAVIGIIGMYRNEKTFKPHEYYHALPKNLAGKITVILDPMLATGGSMLAAVKLLKEKGSTDIRAITLVAAPEGVRRFERRYPDVRVYTAAIDRYLSKRAYIVPGIGDAGDRFCGTPARRMA